MSWLSLAAIPKLLFLLLPILISAVNYRAADLESKSAIELEEYRRHLAEELQRVAEKVEATRSESSTKRGKRTLLSPLSASIPDRDSSYILDRIQTLSGKYNNVNVIDDEVIETTTTPAGESELREPRIDEKLIALLNSLDDIAFDNSTTVEGSGEEGDIATTVFMPTLTTTERSKTTTRVTETTENEETTTTSTATENDKSSDILMSELDEVLTPSSISIPTTTSTMSPRRSPAHGVVISVASPQSPSLSQALANFSSMASMDRRPTTSSIPASTTTEATMSDVSEREERREPMQAAAARRVIFNPTVNHTAEECRKLSQHELVRELKQKGTYNPDLMAWDVFGILRFLDRTIAEQYEMQMRNRTRGVEAAERNIEALSKILGELDVSCDVRSDTVRERMQNMTMIEPRRSILSPHIRRRSKREAVLEELSRLMANFDENKTRSTTTSQPTSTTSAPIYETVGSRQKLIGESHVVPFGCDRRGTEEDGYLRLCSACQSIRRLPDSFFPPFINEVTCDEDNACLYFYDYPHGRCKQKHMNFVVLRNIGSQECQVWRKFNLNVRVSCECFVDEMSFFAKYV